MQAQLVHQAADRIAGSLHVTAVHTSSTLDTLVGTSVVLADEAAQKTGSFKARGALNRVLTRTPDELGRGLLTISAGNHACALAWAAAQVGAALTVVMPSRAPAAKVAASRGYGADVVLHGDTTSEALVECLRLRDELGLVLIHPFDDLQVVAGQGTVATELIDRVGPVDVWIVPVGGGGLACGTALAMREANPQCRVIGVEPAEAPTMTAALAAGRPVSITARSLADGLNAPGAGEQTLPLYRELVDETVLLTEDEILAGVRFVMERLKIVAEPAGAAGVAALLAARIGDLAGQRVASTISGGNLDLQTVVAALP